VVRLDGDFDATGLVIRIAFEPDVPVNKSGKGLNRVQNGLNFELNSWSPCRVLALFSNWQTTRISWDQLFVFPPARSSRRLWAGAASGGDGLPNSCSRRRRSPRVTDSPAPAHRRAGDARKNVNASKKLAKKACKKPKTPQNHPQMVRQSRFWYGFSLHLGNPINTLIAIAITLAILYSLVKPMAEGLYDTSMWVAKILTPENSNDSAAVKQSIKFGQAALMDGWLSNIPFLASLLFFGSIVVAFCFHWWAAIGMYFLAATLGAITKIFFVRPVAYYLMFLNHKMINRRADYKTKNDTQRFEASDSFCRDLETILLIYQDSKIRPPTPKQLKDIPYGDINYWLSKNES
jgi:hypothetical protein